VSQALFEDFDEPAIGSVIFPLDDLVGRVKAAAK
jgi:hypothetical protein